MPGLLFTCFILLPQAKCTDSVEPDNDNVANKAKSFSPIWDDYPERAEDGVSIVGCWVELERASWTQTLLCAKTQLNLEAERHQEIQMAEDNPGRLEKVPKQEWAWWSRIWKANTAELRWGIETKQGRRDDSCRVKSSKMESQWSRYL